MLETCRISAIDVSKLSRRLRVVRLASYWTVLGGSSVAGFLLGLSILFLATDPAVIYLITLALFSFNVPFVVYLWATVGVINLKSIKRQFVCFLLLSLYALLAVIAMSVALMSEQENLPSQDPVIAL